MHELILDLLREQPGSALARFPLDDGALVCLFHGGACPRWIAKTAGDAGIHRLRAEATALKYLEPWPGILNIPRRLGWHDGARAPDGVACLVQSVISGVPIRGACDLRRPWAALPEETRRMAAWLRRFQVTVPPPSILTLTELDQRARSQAERDGLSHPQYAALLRPALAALPQLPEPRRPATALHGDFWSGNVLWDGKRGLSQAIGVIDWSGFGAGTALDDLLTWTACVGAARNPVPARLERWQGMFFSAGTARDFLRAASAGCGYGESLARWAFYRFLLRRMSWELGLGLQARDATERASAQREWTEITAWLAAHRFPDPFTPMPV